MSSLILLRLVASRAPLLQVSRPINTTRLLFSTLNNPASLKSSVTPAPKVKAAVSATLGSGKGGKKEKDEAAKAKASKQKEKDSVAKKDKGAATKEAAKVKKAEVKAKKLAHENREKEVKAKLKKEKSKLKAAALKLKLKEKAAKLKVKEAAVKIKKTSTLTAPTAIPTAWRLFLTKYITEQKAALAPGEKLKSMPIHAQAAATLYKDLPYHERAELEEQVAVKKAEYPGVFEAWKATLTPQMIKEENAVRAYRRKKGLSHKRLLRIEGEPKRPLMPYIAFSNDMRANNAEEVLGGETNILAQSKLIAAEWKRISAEDKQVYADKYAQDKIVYDAEKKAFDASLAPEQA